MKKQISKELYDGSGHIIQALLNEDAPQGIDEYPYASAVLSRFVHHARIHCKTVEDFHPLIQISEYLNADQEIWEERFMDQWKQHEYKSILEAMQPFLNSPQWTQATSK